MFETERGRDGREEKRQNGEASEEKQIEGRESSVDGQKRVGGVLGEGDEMRWITVRGVGYGIHDR